jgi:hypothetical protein
MIEKEGNHCQFMCIGVIRGHTDSCSFVSDAGTGHICCDSTHEEGEIVVGARLISRSYWRGPAAFGR